MVDADCRDEDILITDDGRVEFTPEGREFYTSFFGYAGIDIRTIKTREDLSRIRRQAFPVRLHGPAPQEAPADA